MITIVLKLSNGTKFSAMDIIDEATDGAVGQELRAMVRDLRLAETGDLRPVAGTTDGGRLIVSTEDVDEDTTIVTYGDGVTERKARPWHRADATAVQQ